SEVRIAQGTARQRALAHVAQTGTLSVAQSPAQSPAQSSAQSPTQSERPSERGLRAATARRTAAGRAPRGPRKMRGRTPMDELPATHDVFNQSPPFVDVNLFTSDLALREAVEREGGGHASERLAAFGARWGSAGAFERGRLANENTPRLRAFDAKGYRLDRVEFPPAYHECMEMSVREGLHCSAWDHLATATAKPVRGANVARSAGCYMAVQM